MSGSVRKPVLRFGRLLSRRPPTARPVAPPTVAPKFIETQELHLCGMHAINNLLQEPKVVFLPNDQRLIIPTPTTALPCDDNPLTKTNQINIAERCRIHQLREEATQSVSGTEINKCDMKTGNFNIEVLQAVLESELDFNTDAIFAITNNSTDKVKLRDFLESHSNTPNLKGFILNYGNGYHWTTVIMNSAPPCNYLLIDSIRIQSIYKQKNYACFENLDTLVDFLVTQNTTEAIAVLNGPNERIHAVEKIFNLDKITARRIVRWTQEGDTKDLYKHERELFDSIDAVEKIETKRQRSRRGGLTEQAIEAQMSLEGDEYDWSEYIQVSASEADIANPAKSAKSTIPTIPTIPAIPANPANPAIPAKSTLAKGTDIESYSEGTQIVTLAGKSFRISVSEEANTRRIGYFSNPSKGGLIRPEQDLLAHLGIDPVQSPLRPLLSEFFMQLPTCQTDTSIFVQQQCEVPYRVLWQQMFLRRKAVEPVKPTIDMFTIAFLEKYLKEADRAIAFANAERLFRTGSLDTVTDTATGTGTDPTTGTATDPTTGTATDLELEALVDLFTF